MGKHNKKGIFCITIDTELLWSRRYDLKNFTPRIKKERVIINKLLKLFKKYNIPVTWAIVGKLFYNPTNSKQESYFWKGKDIINKIIKNPNQEIACHSFSHKVFTQISKREAMSEVKKCVNIAEKNNIKLNSFVYPKNEIAYLNILKNMGFICYRGKSKHQSKISQILNLINPLGESSQLKINEGILNIPATMYFPSSRGFKKHIPNNIVVHKIKVGINKAIKNGELFHLWFHPTDLTEDTNKLISRLEKILIFSDKKRKENLLEIKTMENIASDLLQN